MATNLGKHAPRVERYEYGPWVITASTSHILSSDGPDRNRYDAELSLPALPEMIFPQNILRLEAASGSASGSGGGFGIEFNALDALKRVDATHDLVKVACAQEWRESRLNNEHIRESAKPYDWTFSTDYTGTLLGHPPLTVAETDERIDLELLKRREKILFYQDILLFEDELSDNGTSILNVKMRVMPSCLFLLMRQYLRVDDVLVRINDTRLFQQAGTDYMLREFSCREQTMKALEKLPMSVITEANEVQEHLQLKVERFEKLTFPTVAMPTAAAALATQPATATTQPSNAGPGVATIPGAQAGDRGS